MQLLTEFVSIVMQPTTLCNLKCGYCYLDTKHLNKRMEIQVAEAVAESIRIQSLDRPVEIVWHGGEPLVTPKSHFRDLLECFEDLRKLNRVVHNVQTNGTRIDEEWIQILKNYGFSIGVSLDGPEWLNHNRVDWSGNSAFPKITKGIRMLKENGFPIHIIAVVGANGLAHARELYHFFADELECNSVGFNVEETEGSYTSTLNAGNKEAIYAFWNDLWQVWVNDKRIGIRELDDVMYYIKDVVEGKPEAERYSKWTRKGGMHVFPTISWCGDVFLLSPELAGAKSPRYQDFIAGNMKQTTLNEIIANAGQLLYVQESLKALDTCEGNCSYFDFCGGGQACNRFFEIGSFEHMQTDFCVNSAQLVFDVVMDNLA